VKKGYEISFSIPHTRRHVKFIGEVEAALKKNKIKYDAEVSVNDEAQESWVRFFTPKGKVDEAYKLCEYVSKNPPKKGGA